jgi:class 3 adenylate cyclase/DNA-binding XRE family transcriptional regulator
MDVAQVGHRIRQRREQVGLRQRDLADALQLSAQAVSKWERGENAPDIGLLPDLARILGITTDWLLAGFDDEPDLLKALERIAMGDTTVLGSRTNTLKPIDEADALLTRLRDLVRVRNMFGQSVPTAVVDAVLRDEVNLAGARVEATVLFSDIRGFMSLSDATEPQVFIALLNRYFEAMVAAIQEFDGTLHQYIGDALFVHWNLPLPQADHALLAVKTALRMRDRLAAFNEDQVARGEPTLRIGIGVNTGSVVAGHVGVEGWKSEYSLMGDGVNRAARLESATKELGADIVIGEATYERVREHIEATGPTEIVLRGTPEPMNAYAVVRLKRV